MKRILSFSVCLLLWASLAPAQGVTTGALAGTVVDPNGDPLPGTTVVAVLTTMGTRYTTIADAAGRFAILNARVGGPYTVSASLSGFQTATAENVYVRLGDQTLLSFELRLEAAAGELIVIGEANPLIGANRMGAASNVGTAALESLPTIGRGLEDFARTNPLFVTNPSEAEATVITVAGRNNRYNNISIDGAVNNDLFGLAATGTPGGQAETVPVSLDAVAELQLVVSSFDVRQGGFTGGSINAITRSGSNRFAGSVYGFYRDDSFVGDGPDSFPELGTFEDTQYGFRIGGPIVQDKAFFFLNFEGSTLDRPTGFSIDGVAGVPWQDGQWVDEANQFRQFIQSQYNYDIGGLGQVTRETPSDKLFARVDFNLDERNNLTFRHNYVDAENLIIRPSSGQYQFPSHNYNMASETNSSVLQWNSVFGDDMFNELRVTYQTIKDRRASTFPPFPYILINDVDGDRNSWAAGPERFSTHNALDQDIIEFTNDFTFFAGDHEIVLGTHNELFSFRNVFIQEGFGAYRFANLDAFYDGIAFQYDITVPAPGADGVDEFDVQHLSFYAGDTWRVKPNLTIVGGLRVDLPLFPDSPTYNPAVEDLYGVNTTEIPDGNILWSPRVGFNWDLTGKGESQLRGGIGLFSGRTPYVWISNNYGRTGIEYLTVRARGAIPFNPDPFNQPTDIGGASTQEVNLIDPDFKFPQVWRLNLGYEQLLPWWNLVGSVEAVYGFSEADILYQNLNIRQTGQVLPFDDRPIYETVSRDFSGAYYLTNSDDDEQLNVTVKLEKPYSAGLWGFVAYTYGRSQVVTDGTSSRAVSNWQFNEAFDPNNPRPGTSDFEVPHRFTASLSYEFNRESPWSTVVSAYYNHQSGRPYTAIYAFSNSASVNQDFFTSNDLAYIPSGPDDVIITNGTWEQLNSWISMVGLDKYKGRVTERNESWAPWTTTLDLGIRQRMPFFAGTNFELTLDILNFLNLLDSDSGHVRFVRFGTVTPFSYQGVDQATGKPIYELRNIVTSPETSSMFQLDNLRSRWQLKLGARWSF